MVCQMCMVGEKGKRCSLQNLHSGEESLRAAQACFVDLSEQMETACRASSFQDLCGLLRKRSRVV